MTDTRTGTRTIAWTPEEIRYLSALVGHDWQVVDDRRMLSRIGSPQEKAAEADQAFIEVVQSKLRGG
jgi:hypothetical protein